MLQHDLVGHSHANTVAFSPDGNLLASSGSWLSPGGNEFGAGVILWNPQTGERIRAITNEANGGTHAVAFSPNSKMIAFGATLFDHENATSFTAVRMAYALSGAVTWAAKLADGATPAGFSPDGESVLVRCQQSIRFLNAETGAVEHEVKAADLSTDGRWDDIAVAPRAGRLIIGSADEAEGNVALWDFAAPAAAATSESRPNGTTDAQ
jgi:WD40 repeat protein